MAINIKDVAKYYAETPSQNRGLELLQVELSRFGLSADSCPWVIEFRKEPEAPEPEKGKSIAASESQRASYTGVINWHNPRCFVSKYFTVAEVTQQDKRRIPNVGSTEANNILKLAKELDKVREAWGHPISITSWYRPKVINAQVGGVRNSTHILGLAADIYPLAGGSVHDLQRWLDHRWGDRMGYGAKKGFCHVDIDGGGGLDRVGKFGKVRWNY
ncbi:D-Ala-D-Ala carboxypeptidase family metallohydrolase [Chroococcidiopsis sp.]|uniref:D-Ala-D-Ala carboxypeptidase family metallohydrolase n=1 Tax=Chroococcidiopsis sp. TaxID=3088168 RepID=UPI003F2C64E2